MKSKNAFYILICLFISISLNGQNLTQNQSPTQKIPNTPDRAATGQTKWMQSQLKFDQQLYSIVYNINLKYQVKTDSIHSSSLTSDEKRSLYLLNSKKRNNELKRILPKQIFDQYQILETSKNPTRN